MQSFDECKKDIQQKHLEITRKTQAMQLIQQCNEYYIALRQYDINAKEYNHLVEYISLVEKTTTVVTREHITELMRCLKEYQIILFEYDIMKCIQCKLYYKCEIPLLRVNTTFKICKEHKK